MLAFVIFSLGLILTYHSLAVCWNPWILGFGIGLQMIAALGWAVYKETEKQARIEQIIDVCFQTLLGFGIIRRKKKDNDKKENF